MERRIISVHRISFPSVSENHQQLFPSSAYLRSTHATLPSYTPPLQTSKMSSMRNAAPRRPHRERSQPASRSKWGLLENTKTTAARPRLQFEKTKLSQLSRKVRERHPDEFAYGMLSKETGRQGKHGKGGDERALGVDAVKLLKTQDGGYLRVVAGRGGGRLGRWRRRLVLVLVGKWKGGRLFLRSRRRA